MKARGWQRLACLALLGLGLLEVGRGAEAPRTATEETRVYHYRMKGKVRLLLFWVGKDDVGGGQISVAETRGGQGNLSRSVEVFFGSNPERVPGRINRWGYGKETARWTREENAPGPILQETLFEGFMKHSQEEGLSEVMENEAEAKSGTQFWYEGTRSLVRPEQAVTELRKFSTDEDFDYLNSQSIRCQYEERLLTGPDKHRELVNAGGGYRRPYGFLTAVQSVVDAAVTEYAGSRRLVGKPEKLSYVYNSQLYELSTRGLELVRQLEVPGDKENPPDVYPLVAKVDFRVRKMAVSGQHDFTLWFPLEGDLKGVPVRILDRPRWWLGIELNLEPNKRAGPIRKGTCD